MDVNGTKFHLVYTEREWLREDASADSKLQWNPANADVSLRMRLFLFPTRKSEAPPKQDQRRGAAFDRFRNLYMISPSRQEILYLSRGESALEHFWSPADSRPCDPAGPFAPKEPTAIEALTLSGLAVTSEHYLVVGVLKPAGLLIFDLFSGGSPTQLCWPEGTPFEPWDMSPAAGGVVFILDRANRRLWKLDRYFRVSAFEPRPEFPKEPEDFQPATGATRYRRPEPPACRITPDLSLDVESFDPISVEALPDGSVFVLDNGPVHSLIRRFAGARPAGKAGLDANLMRLAEEPAPVHAHDFAFQGETLYVVSGEGNQTFAFHTALKELDFTLALSPDYYPMRDYAGKGLIGAHGKVYYDSARGWAALAVQPRPRYEEEGLVELGPFDGKEPGCVWHRVFFDGCIPPGAEVVVQTRASDQIETIAQRDWETEPTPYLRSRSAELPFYRPPLPSHPGRTGTFETLLQNAAGRYLQVRVILRGTGRNTPRIQALRIGYPRFSYLKNYLPAVYRDDPVSASFLERYLANPEGFFTNLEDKIAQAQFLLDTETAAPEFLEWLASWMGATLDVSWSAYKRRLFLSHAMQIFRERGTLAGIRRMLRLALDECVDESLFAPDECSRKMEPFSVRIVERFLTRRAPGIVYGDRSELVGPASTTDAGQWTPSQGAEPLDQLWRDYLKSKNLAVEAGAWFPAIRPAGARASEWEVFVRGYLPFTYATVTEADLDLYVSFLQRQYIHPEDLNRAYKLAGAGALASFSQAAQKLVKDRWKGNLPRSGLELQDWIKFVSVVVPTHRNAHRFRVLVPVKPTDSVTTQQRKLELARRVAEEQKPAHTDFDVKLYWAMFRLGESLLGIDTVLGYSARSTPLMLGASALGSSHLAPPPNSVRLTLPKSLLEGATL